MTNNTANEILSYLGISKIDKNSMKHYGVKRRSGRYKWGSGKTPFQHSTDFLSRVDELSKQGMSEKDISEALGLSTTQLRIQKDLAKSERRDIQVAQAKSLREKGLSLQKIAEEMGFANDSSVRSLLNENVKAKQDLSRKTADFLKEQVDAKGMIQVGAGTNLELNISQERLNTALYLLELEGYNTYSGRVDQVTNPGKKTTIKVLTPPNTPHKDIFDLENINTLNDYVSHDGGETFNTFKYPTSLDSKRLAIRYAEDGGTKKDGVVELRRNVDDLSLGNSNYAQVRILVDGNKYIKGMAVYSDDLPPGVDIMFNTNKSNSKSKLEVLKDISDNPENPFGSLIKAGGQSYYTDKNGNKQLSLINKRAEEGDWGDWADKLPSQFLAKQNMDLIKKQLNITYLDKEAEFDEIMSLTNPTLKKHMLSSFADDADSSSVHLKAAALPRQKYQVLLPVNSLKENEVYAPNYKNGEKIALVRFPHGGTFEIPILTVNNKNQEGRDILGAQAKDVFGINSKVAERLSGADFDGDTAMGIPISNKVKISSTQPLKELVGFDNKLEYPYKEGMKVMSDKNTGREMGMISNLITDMTIRGATSEELARATKHSMVVIDAAKHKLNYKQSEIDNDIPTLKNKYQGYIADNGEYRSGASTLISRSKSPTNVTKYKGDPNIDPKTGRVSYTEAFTEKQRPKDIYETYVNSKGETVSRTKQVSLMSTIDDARRLSSGTPQEEAYADYANKMKALANKSRKEMVNTAKSTYDREASKKYASEVESLNAKLNISLLNQPRERQAQVIANTTIDAIKKSNPDLSKSELKKINQQELTKARAQVGAKRNTIDITDNEWKAIQAGAISDTKQSSIFKYADSDRLRQLATPKTTTTMSSAKLNRAKTMADCGYTTSEIASALGVSVNSIQNALKG